MGRGLNMGNPGITTHKGAIGSTTAVLVLIEENALIRTSHTDDTVVLIDFVVDISRCVSHIARDVIHKVLWGFLDGDVLRVTIHATHITMHYLTIVA